ncbi:MAG: GNAT family N-acetyltransferase [Candidatus Dormiibacterota bacterium]
MTSSDRAAHEVAGDHRTGVDITIVSDESQVQRLLPLMRGYCDFYHAAPTDAALLTMSRALAADHVHEGVQLLATERGVDVGFATLFWSWETTISSRVGVMNDLYVVASSRGRGVSSALIRACVSQCRERGAARMIWQTAHDNLRAQAVYDHAGATRESWLDYWLDTSGASA